MPLPAFVNPVSFLFLATIGYGWPVLLLRDFAVRSGLGLLGMLPLGLCYGIVNEGFLAKTFFRAHGVPINSFDDYGFVGGIDVPWALLISSWHMLFAFLFPILLTEWAFPAHRGKPWLGSRSSKVVGGLEVLACVAVFFTAAKPWAPGLPVHFLVITAAFLGLAFLATRLPALPIVEPGEVPRLRKFFAGLGAFLFVLVFPAVFSGLKLPVPLFFGYYIGAAMLAYLWLAKRRRVWERSAILFGLGLYSGQALMGTALGIATNSPVLAFTDITLCLVFGAVAYRVLAKPAQTIGTATL
jgi:hypothetical protein